METTSKHLERENPSPLNSPNSNGSTTMSSSNSNNNNQTQTPPLTPKPMSSSSSRSDQTNPYPTTFVQADTTTFKQVVQMLTGATKPTPPEFPPPAAKNFTPPIKTAPKKQHSFKLYERRNQLKNSLMINPLVPRIVHNSSGFNSPRNNQEILSPSLLDFPKLVLSPVTPLNEDPFNKSSPSVASLTSEEEKAIAEKGFYLHPSPITTPRESEPQLLPLFPVTSPRLSGSSAS